MRQNRIWLTTDTHFNHKKVEEFCDRKKGWESKLYHNILELPFEDTLIHLGDVCIGNDYEEHALFRMTGYRKILIRGNHDRKTINWYLNNGWDMVCDSLGVRYHGASVLLSHAPMKCNKKEYDINIHGHFHNLPIKHCYKCEPNLPPYVKGWHYRLSCEELNYQPILLERLIKEWRK